MDFDLPDTPDMPPTRFRFDVDISDYNVDPTPSMVDTIQGEVTRSARSRGLVGETDVVSVSVGRGVPMQGGADDVAVTFPTNEMTPDEISQAARLIVSRMRDYEVPANDEDVTVHARPLVRLGDL